MTDIQKAKFKRNSAVIDYLESNKKVFENDESLIHFYEKLIKDHQKAIESEFEISKDETAYNLEKARLKKEVCTLASNLSQTAQAAFVEWGERNLLKDAKVGYVHFSRYNDFITEERLKNTYRILHKDIHSLSPKYITSEELASFKEKIKEYADTPGSSSILDRPSTELTGKLRADLKLTDTDTRYILEIAEKYKIENADFYNKIVDYCTLPPMEEEPATTVTFLVSDSKDGLPLTDVAVKLNKLEETPVSDKDGKIFCSPVKAGRGVATFALPGYNENVSIVKIKAATDNVFEILMNKL